MRDTVASIIRTVDVRRHVVVNEEAHITFQPRQLSASGKGHTAESERGRKHLRTDGREGKRSGGTSTKRRGTERAGTREGQWENNRRRETGGRGGEREEEEGAISDEHTTGAPQMGGQHDRGERRSDKGEQLH